MPYYSRGTKSIWQLSVIPASANDKLTSTATPFSITAKLACGNWNFSMQFCNNLLTGILEGTLTFAVLPSTEETMTTPILEGKGASSESESSSGSPSSESSESEDDELLPLHLIIGTATIPRTNNPTIIATGHNNGTPLTNSLSVKVLMNSISPRTAGSTSSKS